MAPSPSCAECGAAFSPSKGYQKFCSRRCQREAGARHDKVARKLLKAALRILAGTNARAA